MAIETAPMTWSSTSSAGRCVKYWYSQWPPGHQHAEEHTRRPPHPLGDVDGMEGDHEGEHDAHQEEGDARVELGHVSQRDGQALGHQLALEPPAWGRPRSWPCRRRGRWRPTPPAAAEQETAWAQEGPLPVS